MKLYYLEGDKQIGPITEKDLGRLIEAGILNESSLVRREDSIDWIRLIETGLVEVKTEAPQKAQAASMLTTIMQKARTNSLRIMFVAGGLFVVGILAVTVWPTLYRYDRVTEGGDTHPIRTHRLSGKTYQLSPTEGWIDTSSSGSYSKTPVPRKELAKLDGEMSISDDSRMEVEIYNGTSRALSSIRVEVIVIEREKAPLESTADSTKSAFGTWKIVKGSVYFPETMSKRETMTTRDALDIAFERGKGRATVDIYSDDFLSSPVGGVAKPMQKKGRTPQFDPFSDEFLYGKQQNAPVKEGVVLRRIYDLTDMSGGKGSPLSTTFFYTSCGSTFKNRYNCQWSIVSATWQ